MKLGNGVFAVGRLIASGGVGYWTGQGGAVTQATSKATGVTLSKLAGQITTHAASLAAGAEVSFVVTNTKVGANDVPVVAIKSGATAGGYGLTVDAVAAGSFQITITNLSGGALAEALVISFVVIRGAVA